MPEVQHVNVQIGENRIVQGFYTLNDGLLTMTDVDGKPVLLHEGTTIESRVERRLSAGDKPHQIAGRLTKDIRRTLLGEEVEGFSNPIDYGQARGRNPIQYKNSGVA